MTRYSSLLAAPVVLGATLIASPALAGNGDVSNDIPASSRAIPEPIVAVEFRFGAYRPQVDSAFANATPYADVFGDKKRFMIGGEVDWQAIHIPHIGSVGLGGMFGYTKASGTAQFSNPAAHPGEVSGEDTSLSLWLLSVLAVVRIDVLARETWIPIVPYGKVGPAMGLWSTSNGLGTSVASDGTVGRGRTNGMFYAVGGMFLLDIFDRQAAKTFAVEQGVKHTYFFAEYSIADLRGLGQSGNVMHVGDNTWTLGLSFEL